MIIAAWPVYPFSASRPFQAENMFDSPADPPTDLYNLEMGRDVLCFNSINLTHAQMKYDVRV